MPFRPPRRDSGHGAHVVFHNSSEERWTPTGIPVGATERAPVPQAGPVATDGGEIDPTAVLQGQSRQSQHHQQVVGRADLVEGGVAVGDA
jgi:hypothetical protein